MAVQIPSLKPINAQGPVSTGRIGTDVANPAEATGAIAKSVTAGVNQVADYYGKVEEQALELAGTSKANEYEVWASVELSKIQQWDGDPTEAYSKFEEQSLAKQDEIISQIPSADTRLQSVIREKMGRVDMSKREKVALSQAIQYAKYDAKTTDASVFLRKQGMIDSVEMFDPKDPNTLIPFQSQLDQIKKLRIDSGRRNGLVMVSEDGKEDYSPALKMQLKKDLSDGLEKTVMTLQAAGKMDAAQQIMDKYSGDMLAETKTTLLTNKKDSMVKLEALAQVEKVANYKDPADAMLALNRIKNPEVKDKAIDIFASRDRHLRQAKEESGKQSYEDLSKVIAERKFLTVSDFENDEMVRRLIGKGRMTQSQIESLKQQVEAPKRSDQDVKGTMYDTMIDGKLGDLTYGQLQDKMTGLNKADRDMFTKKWEGEKSQTPSEKKGMITYMGTQLRSQLLASKVIKRDAYNRYSDKEEIKYVDAYNKMMEAIDSFPPGASVVEQNKWVQKFATDYSKGQVFGGVVGTQKFDSSPTKTPSTKAAPTDGPTPSTAALGRDGAKAWAKKFYDVNGRSFDPAKGDNMQDFIKSQKGKL